MRPRSRSTGLLVQQVGDQLVAYDQSGQRLHVLNRTAAATWRHCNGLHDIRELAELVGRELGIPADEQLIELALQQLDDARLLEERVEAAGGENVASRREMLRWAAAAAVGVFLPTITSCGSPLGPDAALNLPGGPRLDIGGLVTTTTTSFAPTTTTTTSFAPTTTTTTTLPPSTTTTTTTTTFPPTTTTTTTTTTFPPTTTTTTTFPPTTTTTTSPPPTTTTTTTPAPRKVRMCHKGKSIMVDADAVEAHLLHGDTLGPCP